MRNPSQVVVKTLFVVAALVAPTFAMGPHDSRLLTADEIAAGASLKGEPDVEYSAHVWDAPGHAWSASDTNGVLTLTRAEGDISGPPRWQQVARIQFTRDVAERVIKLAPVAENSEKQPPPPVPPLMLVTPDAEPKLDEIVRLVRGRLDTPAPTGDARRTTIRTNQQGANFQAPPTADAWRARARELREQLLVTLGLWPMPPRTPLNAQVFGKIEHEDYTIERVVLETLPGFYLAGNLYRPRAEHGRAPAILNPHGHWEDGRVNPEVQQRCIRWAKLGFVAFMYDMVGYNDSKDFQHEFLDPTLTRWGYSLATLQTWNSIRVLDWITTLPDVDAARIGCTGESGGGTQTFLLTALDPRVKVAAPVVMVSEYFQGGCVCENAAGLRHGTDNIEFAALAAPRPMKLVGATGDWTVHTNTLILPVLKSVYTLVGDPAHLEAETFTFPHNYNQTSRNAIYPFLSGRLGGESDPEKVKEGDQSPEPPANLLAFGDDHPAPSDRKTAEQLKSDLIETLGQQLTALGPDCAPTDWEARRQHLLTALRVRTGIENPAAGELSTQLVREDKLNATQLSHFLVKNANDGSQISVVRLTPEKPNGKTVVLTHGRGKAGLIDAGGAFSPEVAALLAAGHSVVGYDPLFVGESVDPNAPRLKRPETAHYLTYNKSLAADRLQDLATIVAWARSQPFSNGISLVALGEAGPLALLGLPVIDGIDRAYVGLGDFRYGSGIEDPPPGLDLPGVLQFGGMKTAAALAAPTPLWVTARADQVSRFWAIAAYTHVGAESAFTVEGAVNDWNALARWLSDGERD